MLFALLSLLIFETSVLDLGKVRADDGFVKTSLVVANDAAEPAKIAFVSASCNCVTASWPQDPVLPGETARIDIVFNPAGLAGKITRTLTVWGRGDKIAASVDITADVEPGAGFSGKVLLCGNFSASSSKLDFGYVPRGTVASRVVTLKNESGQTLELEASVSRKSRLDALCPGKFAPGETADFVLRYEMPDNVFSIGACRDTVVLRCGSCVTRFPVSALCTESSPYMRGAGPAMWTTNSPVEATMGYIEIGNSGKEPLKIVKVETSDGTALSAPSSVAPGKKARIKFKKDITASSILIFTDDPVRPCREIRINNQFHN